MESGYPKIELNPKGIMRDTYKGNKRIVKVVDVKYKRISLMSFF